MALQRLPSVPQQSVTLCLLVVVVLSVLCLITPVVDASRLRHKHRAQLHTQWQEGSDIEPVSVTRVKARVLTSRLDWTTLCDPHSPHRRIPADEVDTESDVTTSEEQKTVKPGDLCPATWGAFIVNVDEKKELLQEILTVSPQMFGQRMESRQQFSVVGCRDVAIPEGGKVSCSLVKSAQNESTESILGIKDTNSVTMAGQELVSINSRIQRLVFPRRSRIAFKVISHSPLRVDFLWEPHRYGREQHDDQYLLERATVLAQKLRVKCVTLRELVRARTATFALGFNSLFKHVVKNLTADAKNISLVVPKFHDKRWYVLRSKISRQYHKFIEQELLQRSSVVRNETCTLAERANIITALEKVEPRDLDRLKLLKERADSRVRLWRETMQNRVEPELMAAAFSKTREMVIQLLRDPHGAEVKSLANFDRQIQEIMAAAK